ncbi:MAG: phosphodiester glycosidase family protein [Armatimonadota bacterium]
MILQTNHRSNTGSVKFAFLLLIAVAAVAVSYAGKSGPAHDKHIKIVNLDINDKIEIKPALAANGQESFDSAMKRIRPFAAINGTYYDKRMRPLGDIVIGGKLVNRGSQRNAIAVTKSGRVEFIRRGKSRFKWSGYSAGLAAGPRLVHEGKIALDPVSDGFTKRSLTVTAWRAGVGKTADNELLLVVAEKSITLKQFADIMLELGAVEAMNLDGGGACALYKDGKYLSKPLLPMTNMLIIKKKPLK